MARATPQLGQNRLPSSIVAAQAGQGIIVGEHYLNIQRKENPLHDTAVWTPGQEVFVGVHAATLLLESVVFSKATS